MSIQHHHGSVVVLYEETRALHGLAPHCSECGDDSCRKQFKCERCGRWRGYCAGHSEGNECITCEFEIVSKIVAYVSCAKRGYRRESKIREHILGKWCAREPTLDENRVDDMLFGLIQDEVLTWDPPVDEETAGEEDIKYRVKKGIRKEKEEVQHEQTRKPRAVRKRVYSVHVPRSRPGAGTLRKRRPNDSAAR